MATTLKVPKTMGGCVDMLYDLRKARHVAQRKVDESRAKESQLQEYLLKNFDKDKLSGARGKKASAGVVVRDIPSLQDYDEFIRFVVKNKAFDLFQRRLSEEACKARWEQGKKIPGVGKFGIVKLSITKL